MLLVADGSRLSSKLRAAFPNLLLYGRAHPLAQQGKPSSSLKIVRQITEQPHPRTPHAHTTNVPMVDSKSICNNHSMAPQIHPSQGGEISHNKTLRLPAGVNCE